MKREGLEDNSYICPHSCTPLRQRRKFHSDAVEVTLKKLASLASIRLRGTVMAVSRLHFSGR